MSVYRRFVTYLFQYENGRKEGSCGFAKVEVRQGRCRMELQLKGCMDGDYLLYLFHAARRGPVGVKIGEIRVRTGSGREIFIFSEDAVGESPYTLNDMNGIRLNADGEGFIASQWDDAEVDFGEFRVYGAGKTETDAGEDEFFQEGNTETPGAGKDEFFRDENEETPGAGPDECVKKQESDRDEHTKSKKSEADGYPKLSESDQGESDAAGEIKVTQTDSCAMPGNSYSNPVASGQGDRLKAAAADISSYMSAWEKQWQRFSASHPVLCPFKNTPNVYAIKMDLRDLGFLPKEYHSLANNSFLLHGYFNY